jgi:hypothetical protein
MFERGIVLARSHKETMRIHQPIAAWCVTSRRRGKEGSGVMRASRKPRGPSWHAVGGLCSFNTWKAASSVASVLSIGIFGAARKLNCFEQQLHTSSPSVCDPVDITPKGAGRGGGASGKRRQSTQAFQALRLSEGQIEKLLICQTIHKRLNRELEPYVLTCEVACPGVQVSKLMKC